MLNAKDRTYSIAQNVESPLRSSIGLIAPGTSLQVVIG